MLVCCDLDGVGMWCWLTDRFVLVRLLGVGSGRYMLKIGNISTQSLRSFLIYWTAKVSLLEVNVMLKLLGNDRISHQDDLCVLNGGEGPNMVPDAAVCCRGGCGREDVRLCVPARPVFPFSVPSRTTVRKCCENYHKLG